MKDNKIKFGLNINKPNTKIIKQDYFDNDEDEYIDIKEEINKNIIKQQEYNKQKVYILNKFSMQVKFVKIWKKII